MKDKSKKICIMGKESFCGQTKNNIEVNGEKIN
jgi:hypothetical protein